VKNNSRFRDEFVLASLEDAFMASIHGIRFPRFSINKQILRNITKMKQKFLEIFVFTAVWIHTDIVFNWPMGLHSLLQAIICTQYVQSNLKWRLMAAEDVGPGPIKFQHFPPCQYLRKRGKFYLN
jgi:hypothetical protein